MSNRVYHGTIRSMAVYSWTGKHKTAGSHYLGGPAMGSQRGYAVGNKGLRVHAATSKTSWYAGVEGNTHTQNKTRSGSLHLGRVAGVAAVGYGGYKAYQHRDEIKAKGAAFGSHVHNAFHSTRHMVGAH